MSKRAQVAPQWLDSMLCKWGRTMPALRGWYTMSPMFKGSIPEKPTEREPFELGPKDYDDLCAAIDELSPKYRAVVYYYYKPWTMATQREILDAYEVTERTWRNWLQQAAGLLEASMANRKHRDSIGVCGN